MATVTEYEVAIYGDNWKGRIKIEAQDAEEAIKKVRDIDLYNSTIQTWTISWVIR